jgi:hypothetical protein
LPSGVSLQAQGKRGGSCSFSFSNQMGWLASIVISLVVTLVLLAIFGIL